MKLILPVVTAVMAFAAIDTVPAVASQAAPAQPAQASHFVQRQSPSSAISPVPWLAANGDFLAPTAIGNLFGITRNLGSAAYFNTFGLGTVHTGWPFSDQGFDNLYANDGVYQFQQTDSLGNVLGCMQTDSVHSGVFEGPCGSHNAGTYWAFIPAGPRGSYCTQTAGWLVNIGITNHYNPYPYGFAMFVNSNNLIYVASARPISVTDQWC